MEWKTLLTEEKLHFEEKEPEQFAQYPINEFEKDYNKIVSSSVFRRLQDKTQVFPLEKSDFIRTRLTHSIEVSTIARQLGIMISKNETQYRPADIDSEVAESIASVLLCAGLLHDLGNPPFGHFGETTIGDWFRENLDTIFYKGKPLRQCLNQQMICDLENFEGNAQALRILMKARHGSEINLSQSIISTLVKYPTDSCSFDGKDPDIRKHKPGFYFAEQEPFQQLVKKVGTVDADGNVCRHPLTFVLEAADDIAYATADLEDAFRKKLFTLDQFIDFFQQGYAEEKAGGYRNPEHYSDVLIKDLIHRREGSRANDEKDARVFQKWLNYTRRWLMYVAVFRFTNKDSYAAIMSGTYRTDLFHDTYHSCTVEILKKAMKEFVFDTKGILKPELSAQSILSFLLKGFVKAALYYDGEDASAGFVPSKADKKYISLLSKNDRQDYQDTKTGDEQMDLYLRLLMVTDYISGMTDTYARTLYRELSGIE